MATVLVVDDEPVIRSLISLVLEEAGHSVLTAHDGPQALAVCHEHHAKIDLLVTDVAMPGMDGPSLALELLADDPNLQILFISGSCETEEQMLHCGQFPFLPKPFSITALLRTVRKLVSSSASPQSVPQTAAAR